MPPGFARRPARLARVIGSVAVISLLAAACSSSSKSTTATGSSTGSAPKGTPYYIGAELSLSGAFSSFELPMLSGLQVAVEEINNSGGVLGHPVALDYQSDASTPTKAPLALQSIFSPGKKIIYMLPNVLPNITATVLQYTEKDGIASFDAGSGPNLFDIATHPYNFSIYPANTLQVPAYVAAFAKITGGAGSGVKLGVLNDTEAADQTLTQLIIAATKQAGGTVVDQEQVDPTATDLSVQVGKLHQANPNVILIQASGNIPFEVAQAVQSLNWTTVKMVASPATLNATTMSAIPAAVASQYYALGEQIYLRNPQGTGPLSQYQAFASLLAKTSGGIDDLEISANIADSATLLAWAVNKAGSTDIKKVLAVLNNLGPTPPPASILTWMPNPMWTASDHTFDKANLSQTFWALLSPGAPVQGTYAGQALTIGSS
jgi:branched-chain amino acid transport system substrate-binding protein